MRDIPVGNGSLLVNFDEHYRIRDVFFPHVGQENHTEGMPSRLGVWADGRFSWVSTDDWSISLGYKSETLVTDVRLKNYELGVELISNDTVASHENVFLRKVTVRNLSPAEREIRVFHHHDFRINENKVADTAYFDPETGCLVHYQKSRYFLIGTDRGFDAIATGRKDFQGHEGTWRDAEDGRLNGGPITEGSADSTAATHLTIEGGGSADLYYWIAAGKSYDDVAAIDRRLRDRSPEVLLDRTAAYWRAWVNKNDTGLDPLPGDWAEQYKRSLLIVRTQIDNGGAILAANDWDVTLRATDHYSYLWPRDGAFVANALDLAGYSHLTRKFFDLCGRIMHPNGYFLQKYNSDGTVASGWHTPIDPLTLQRQAPIQEDETALVLWALWEHYARYRDIEFAHRLYSGLVLPCARFLASFRHDELFLPAPSWNLWEDRRGIHTFTCASVVAGLRAAACFAELFADDAEAAEFRHIADRFADSMLRHLYSERLGRFVRSIPFNGNEPGEPDETVDASLFAVFYFGVFDAARPEVAGTMQAVADKLRSAGGISRFENDGYMRPGGAELGNPWFICTLWLAEYHIAIANSRAELAAAGELIQWTLDRSLPSGVMAEQIDSVSGEPASVSPLTWSHSTFVATTMAYLKKWRELNG